MYISTNAFSKNALCKWNAFFLLKWTTEHCYFGPKYSKRHCTVTYTKFFWSWLHHMIWTTFSLAKIAPGPEPWKMPICALPEMFWGTTPIADPDPHTEIITHVPWPCNVQFVAVPPPLYDPWIKCSFSNYCIFLQIMHL